MMMQVIFISGDETKTEVDNTDNQSDNSYFTVNCLLNLAAILFFHKLIRL